MTQGNREDEYWTLVEQEQAKRAALVHSAIEKHWGIRYERAATLRRRAMAERMKRPYTPAEIAEQDAEWEANQRFWELCYDHLLLDGLPDWDVSTLPYAKDADDAIARGIDERAEYRNVHE